MAFSVSILGEESFVQAVPVDLRLPFLITPFVFWRTLSVLCVAIAHFFNLVQFSNIMLFLHSANSLSEIYISLENLEVEA